MKRPRSVAAAGVFALAALLVAASGTVAFADCPGGVEVRGPAGEVVCEPDPSPTPSPTKSPTKKPTPKPSPRPTQTSTPRPTARPTSNPTTAPIRATTGPSSPAPTPTLTPPGTPGYGGFFGEDPGTPLRGERAGPLSSYTTPTSQGLAIAPGTATDRGRPVRIIVLFLSAFALGGSLVRARVRRWMIGI